MYNITEAIEATEKMEWSDKGYISAKVEVTKYSDGKIEIECGIYANTQWGLGATFEAALIDLNSKLGGRTGAPVTGEVIVNA